jgi:FtsH-binding integral membrane protein
VYEQTSPSTYVPSREAAISTSRLLGQVMFLVAIAIGFLALGTVLGKDLSQGAAFACSIGGFGMLMIQSFGGQRFRVGAFAIGWLYALAFAIGLGLGPTINYFTTVDPDALVAAAGGTALTVVGTGAIGFFMAKDLAPWMRPLSLIVFALVLVSLGFLIFGGAGALSPLISLAIYGLSAALIMVYFNYLRKHGTEDDTVLLATGIFVGIVNIFISLLNLFSE